MSNPAANESHLFAYGTLLIPEIWTKVTGRIDRGDPAVVKGFCVRRVLDDLYPVLIRNAGESANGVVYRDIDRQMWRTLERYETDFYVRRSVIALLNDSTGAQECEAFVLPEAHRRFASNEPWDVETFEREDLDEYLRRFG